MTFEPGQLVNIRVAGAGLVARGLYVRPSEDQYGGLHWLEITHIYDTLGMTDDKLHVGLVREVHQEHIEDTSPLERLAQAAE